MINIRITAETLTTLLAPRFTITACERICELLEEAGEAESWLLGDIAISFTEMPREWVDELDEDTAWWDLENGNILVAE